MTSTDNKIVADGGRQGTIFCVDAAEYMFEVNDNDEEKRTHMLIALKVILHLYIWATLTSTI